MAATTQGTVKIMGLYQRNNRYYFKKQIDGHAYYAALHLRHGQESLLSARIKQIEEEIVARHFRLPSVYPKTIGFVDYCKKYLDQKAHKKSLDRDRQRLVLMMQFWGNIPLSGISKASINNLEKHLFTTKRKSTTVNRYFELLSHLFSLAIQDHYLNENPCKFYQRFVEDTTRRALSDNEITILLACAKGMKNDPKNPIQAIMYDLILFSLNTGMRLSEILYLKTEHIQDSLILLPITTTKYRRRIATGRSPRKLKIIYLNNICQDIIQQYATNSGYVFPMPWRNPNAIFHTVRRLRGITGISDFTFHQLRHTTATWLSAQVSLLTAKTILGHADIQTTLRYAHPEIEEQKKGVAKIEEHILGMLPN